MVSYDYYRIFYYVGTYHSFTHAARMLGSNQPNVTRAMNNLEADLDCKLMDRGKRGIKLTPAGQKLYEHVAIAYEQLYNGEQELRKDISMTAGQVTIAASENALRLVLLPVLKKYKERFPDISISISNHSTPRAIRALQNGLADLALVTTPLSVSGDLSPEPLFSFKEIPIVGPGLRHLAEQPQPLRELVKYPLISVGRETGTREMYVQYFLNHQLVFEPKLEASSTDQILPMVEYDLGIGFYPEALVQGALERGRVFRIPLTDPLPERTFCVVVDHSRSLSTAAVALMREFIQTKS